MVYENQRFSEDPEYSGDAGIVKQIGFCLVCGNSVHTDHEFTETDEGYCHENCLR